MHNIKRAVAVTVAASTAAAVVTVTGSSPAHASGGGNCVSQSEKVHLRPGMSPGQVRRITHANPWFRTQDYLDDGTRVEIEVYNDCRAYSGKVVGVGYRVNSTGGRRLLLVKYLSI